ncbi:hypothetical protein C1645_760371 [Glomus cerebriforme]|uniref:Uncharacterized protein n=1 Tax=Glomus cerebriforme TaxID=658196 RepID=A0A397T808_9GLOM|nr:hypothetical protein C1645_760371 [Glomus cerebriforme]
MNENRETPSFTLLRIKRNTCFGMILLKKLTNMKILIISPAWTVARSSQILRRRLGEDTGNKRSLIGEKIYEEFSTKFWLKPELSFEREHSESVRRLSRASLSSSLSHERSSSSVSRRARLSGIPKPTTPNSSETTPRPLTPSTNETLPISRPVPNYPFFFAKCGCDQCYY